MNASGFGTGAYIVVVYIVSFLFSGPAVVEASCTENTDVVLERVIDVAVNAVFDAVDGAMVDVCDTASCCVLVEGSRLSWPDGSLNLAARVAPRRAAKASGPILIACDSNLCLQSFQRWNG